MKNRIFILLGLLLVLSVFVLSCSQAGADDDALDKFEQMLEELSSEGDTSVAPEPVAERIYVIIPEDASAELCQKAKEFSENIASKTEIECSVKYDYEYTKRYDGDLLVLLGNTDDARSKDASANLRVGEYACRWDRGDIIIAAKDHTAAVSAADEFMSTVLTGASKYSLMSEGAGFEHTEEYEVSEVLINGYDLYDFSLVGSQDTIEMAHIPAHKIVSMGMVHVPEGRRIFQSLSVYDNLLMGAYTRKDKSGIEETMKKVFRDFPRLEERKKQLAGTLSGGEQQMLAMGRALLADPELIVLDEPSMGLSPLLVSEIFEIVKSFRDAGKTVLLVEQNAKKAMSISDRVYVLETGSITMSGNASELINDPSIKKAYLGEA